jgi:acyl dehydratase
MTNVSGIEEERMAEHSSVGKSLPPKTVVIERGPVSNFATAVTDKNAVYHDETQARQQGFEAIPAPPTWGFAMGNWGAFPEIQPEGASDTSPILEAIGALMSQGGMILHGEEEFIYHRPLVVGDQLTSSGSIKDVYEKQGSGGRKMTFVITETTWSDPQGDPVLTEVMTLLHRG